VPRTAKSHVPSRKIKAPKQNITKPDGCPTCLAVYRDKVAGAVGRWTNRQMPAGSLSGTSSPVPHTEAEWAPGPFRHARSSGPLFGARVHRASPVFTQNFGERGKMMCSVWKLAVPC